MVCSELCVVKVINYITTNTKSLFSSSTDAKTPWSREFGSDFSEYLICECGTCDSLINQSEMAMGGTCGQHPMR